MTTLRRLYSRMRAIPALAEVLTTQSRAVPRRVPGNGWDEALCDYWHGIFRSLGPGLALWIAEDDGHVVGTVQLAPCQRSNGRHRGDVQKLLVHRSTQGRGVATLLMDAVEEHARASGLSLLVLDTHSGSRAETLYRNRGWLAAGSIPGYAAVPDGSLIATTYFHKEL